MLIDVNLKYSVFASGVSIRYLNKNVNI